MKSKIRYGRDDIKSNTHSFIKKLCTEHLLHSMCGSSAGERVAMEKDKTLALEPRVEHNQSSVHNFYINYIVFMALIPQYKKQIGKKKRENITCG